MEDSEKSDRVTTTPTSEATYPTTTRYAPKRSCPTFLTIHSGELPTEAVLRKRARASARVRASVCV